MAPKALLPIAGGSEEIEAVTIIDTLRRAEVEVVVASVSKKTITASRGVKIEADCLIDDCEGADFDLIALPGGMPGAENLAACSPLLKMLENQKHAGKYYAAICASPAVVLAPNGLLDGLKATCYPAMKDKIVRWVDKPVVIDENCITSQGPATAMMFSLKLVEVLTDKQTAEKIAKAMLCS